MSIPEVSSRSRLLAFLQGALKKLNSLTIGNYTFPTSDGTEDQVLTTDGAGTLTFEDAGGGGGGDVSVSGTPSNNEVPTWTDGTTIKGEGNLTFDGTTLALAGNQTIITSNEGLTNDRALFVQNTADHCNIVVDAAASHEANIVFSENTSIKWAIGNAESNDDLQFRINGWAQKAALSQTGDLQIDGDLTVTGNDIKGSGGTVITMDATNDVNLAGDLTVNGGDLFIKSTVGVADLFLRRTTAGLVDGDDLGNIIFQASEDGIGIAWSPAVIKAECSETFVEGSNEGTRLKFLTTPNGAAAATTNMILDGNGNLDIDGALTLGAGVTSALGSEITTDVSAVDEWTKVAEADLSLDTFMIGTATINVLLIGYEGSEEMYLATCNILAHRYAPSRSHLQVDIIQDEGSVAWDTSDFSLTQNTSVAELWVKAPAANHTCYATITNGTTGGDSGVAPYKSDWILTPNQTWGSLVPLTDTATTTNVKKRFDSLVIDGDLTVTGNDIKGSGGTAITMDGSNNVTIAGDLTVSGQPAVCAVLTSNQAIGSSLTKIIFDSVTAPGTPSPVSLFDVGGDYDTSTGIFTAPADGKYLISANLLLINAVVTDATVISCVTTKSTAGTDYLQANYWGADALNVAAVAGTNFSIQGTWLVNMDQNDQAYINTQNTAGSVTTEVWGHANYWHTRLNIIKVA